MTKPTIHGNGTSALSLATAYGDAYAAIQAAGVVLKETAPPTPATTTAARSSTRRPWSTGTACAGWSR